MCRQWPDIRYSSHSQSDTGELGQRRNHRAAPPALPDAPDGPVGRVHHQRGAASRDSPDSPLARSLVRFRPRAGVRETAGTRRIIPARGTWIGFETNERDELRVRLNNGSSLSALTVLRLFGLETGYELLHAFKNADTDPSRRFIRNTIAAGDCRSRDDALFQIYAEVALGAPPNRESAERRIKRLFFSPQHYSLSAVGRHMLNRRFGTDETSLQLTCDDLVRIVGHVIKLSLERADADDIDHLANRTSLSRCADPPG